MDIKNVDLFAKLKRLGCILLGNTLLCLGLVVFIFPNNIIMGGSTGLALAANAYWNIPITTFVWCFNIVVFSLGLWVLGKEFALTTLVSSFYFPFILDVLQRIPQIQTVTQDIMLATICGGLLIGIGIGVILYAGASTGGIDILSLILNRKVGLSISVGLYLFDFTVLIAQMFYSKTEQILYGIVLVLIYTVVIDKVLLWGSSKIQVQIISDKLEEINHEILYTIDRGSTFLQATTGFLKADTQVLLTVISNRELMQLKQAISRIDPYAFLVINNVNEVRGRGFTKKR
ncbi:YitT family protein [Chakrabartyella piscis]|uniref:YitT family protein n=1 Tax=Chakrabartyella piscis TaxID=2918914 RepID=UPI002958D22E|nr:YitT family protein [Chakrabartyella piscis]